MDGPAHLKRAKDALSGSGSPRHRLRVAAREFWWAVFDYESWPPRLQKRAAEILPRLYRRGATDEKVLNASEGTIETLSDEIKAFCDEAESCGLVGDSDKPDSPPAA